MNVLVIVRSSKFVTFINDFERNETEQKQIISICWVNDWYRQIQLPLCISLIILQVQKIEL